MERKGTEADGSYYLLNAYEYYYVGALYLGGDHQPIPLIWDTGSEWLVVASYQCTSCKSNYSYDYSVDYGTNFKVEDTS